MTTRVFKSTALIAAAFTAALAFAPQEAQAGKTGYFVGGVAAGVGGLLLLDAASRGYGYRSRAYTTRGYYAPRRYYRTARSCRSTRSTFRKLSRRHGFHSFHNVRYRSHAIKMRAWKYGNLYKLKAARCSGNLIWSRVI